ncbi:unnamed protein product [Adineta steineri]|uniref:Uncharacterized protein n=1 Tax=Adineta steineri TaxID=433720 RepID=A0A818VRU4_9BILA|nr:unnamed protein product [Adineta steineri]CAF0767157.1 unnamed protein product [Adineta steineri]CAF3487763.1 unnamed protein product [Adineta steineri]CAF3714944.1 unnamed protein product [Adineta steineri]
MRLLCLITLFIAFTTNYCQDLEKYRLLREQCEHFPSNSECVELKTKFLNLYKKCQKITTPQQRLICQEVQVKLCFLFPSACGQTTQKPTSSSSLAKKKVTKKKLVTKPKLVETTTTTTTTTVIKPKSVVTTKKSTIITTITTSKEKLSINSTLSNEEFVKVPFDPDELRTRGEYCIRHGKEKKCQELLTNLKTTYSTCGKKTATPKPQQIDCHSFQTHLCKAFPKFPPCLKKTTT